MSIFKRKDDDYSVLKRMAKAEKRKETLKQNVLKQEKKEGLRKAELGLLKHRKTGLLKEKEYRDEKKQLKKDIRHLQTERYAGPLINSAQKGISLLQHGTERTITRKGARRMTRSHGKGALSFGSSPPSFFGSSNEKKENKEHYLEF